MIEKIKSTYVIVYQIYKRSTDNFIYRIDEQKPMINKGDTCDNNIRLARPLENQMPIVLQKNPVLVQSRKVVKSGKKSN